MKSSSTTDIVDALVSKGVLTEEEGKLISKGHESKKKSEGNIGFKNGFKINSGDGKSNFSVNGRIQADYRYFDIGNGEAAGTNTTGEMNADTYDIRRAYLGAKGTFRDWINFEATIDAAGSAAYVKYYWLETAFSDKFKIRFGQFKPGFGLEQNTSSRFIDMTERDWAASIAPGVNKGIMVHGVPTPGITYAFTMFNGPANTTASYIADASQKSAELSNNQDGKSYAARLTANIAELVGNKDAIMHLGADYVYDDNATGATAGALYFRTNARGTGFFSTKAAGAGANGAMYFSPDITRYGLEGIGSYGPVKLQAEYANMEFSENAKNNKSLDAYYVNLSWMITGESYASAYKNGLMDRMSPKNDFTGLGSGGMGAWELGVRYSVFNAEDFILGTDTTTDASTNKAHSYTAGVKWIVDPNTRFLLDYVYTDFENNIFGNQKENANAVVGGAKFNKENAVNFRAQFDF